MKGKDNYNKNALRDEHKLWWEKRKESDTFFLVLTRLAMNRDYLLFKLEGSFDVTESSGDAIPCSRHHSLFEPVGCKIHHHMVTEQ